MTRSAVSQGLQRLEDRLGLAFVQRTTRSVHLTEAGEQLYSVVRPAVADVRTALQAVQDLRTRPSGTLRLSVSSIAKTFLSGTFLASFLAAYPDIRLDLTITDDEFDIVRQGYDAGVRLGEVIEQDMIAVPVSTEQRQFAVASKSYLSRPRCSFSSGRIDRTCLHRLASSARCCSLPLGIYRKQARLRRFGRAGVTTNDMGIMIRLACSGAGITFGMEETFRPYVTRGELVPILEAFCPPFPGFYLYYPKRQHQRLKLRALVDYLRLWKRDNSR